MPLTEVLSRDWWAILIRGIAAMLFGFLALIWPQGTLLVLVLLFGAYALVDGVAEIAQAILLRRSLSHEWLLIVSGALSVLLGVFLMIFPGAGALGVVWVLGLYALAFGMLLIGLSLRLRQSYHSLSSTGATTQRPSGMAHSV